MTAPSLEDRWFRSPQGLRLEEIWTWESRPGSGASVLEEVPPGS